MGTHERLIRAVEKLGASIRPGRSRARELARTLRRLRDARRLADYELQAEEFTAEYAADIVERARSAAVFCDDIERQTAAAPPKSGA